MKIELTGGELLYAAAQHVLYISPSSEDGQFPPGSKCSVHFVDGSVFYSKEDPYHLDLRRTWAVRNIYKFSE